MFETLEMGIEYDELVVSEDLPAKLVKAIYEDYGPVKLTLSQHLPDNHMTLMLNGKFAATVNIECYEDECSG